MITLLPLQNLIKFIAVTYAVFVLALVLICSSSNENALFIAIRGAIFLEIAMITFFTFGWRWLWKKFPWLNTNIYPDLNGKWNVSIFWSRGNETGSKPATAFIKQNFFRLSMELVSNESESETLMVKPSKDPESDRPIIFYIYRNEPATGVSSEQNSHKGAAILKLDLENPNFLKGNYFTDRATSGHFEMHRD